MLCRSVIRHFKLRIYCIWIVGEYIEGKRLPKADFRSSYFNDAL